MAAGARPFQWWRCLCVSLGPAARFAARCRGMDRRRGRMVGAPRGLVTREGAARAVGVRRRLGIFRTGRWWSCAS
eukprot:11180122-Lingulodinium_polyedra.AAC.1